MLRMSLRMTPGSTINNIGTAALLIGVILLGPRDAGATLIHQESFEAAPSVGTYTTQGEFNTGTDYFTRADNTFGPYSPHPTNPDGSFYYVAEDTDPGSGTAGGFGRITLVSVDVSTFTNLQVRLSVADADGDFETSDYVELYVAINGLPATTLIGALRGNSPNDDTLSNDADLDGVGDGLPSTTSDFQDFTYNIPGTPSSVVVSVDVRSSANNEQIAIDNIRILGTAIPEPSSVFLLGVGGLYFIVVRRRMVQDLFPR